MRRGGHGKRDLPRVDNGMDCVIMALMACFTTIEWQIPENDIQVSDGEEDASLPHPSRDRQ